MLPAAYGETALSRVPPPGESREHGGTCRPGSGEDSEMSNFSGNILSEEVGLVTEAPTAQAAIAGRSLRALAWRRLKKDKVALAGGVVVVLLLLAAIFAPLITKLLG